MAPSGTAQPVSILLTPGIFGAVARLASVVSEVAASPTALQANAERDGSADPLRARSGARFLDRRTWVEPVLTPTQHLFEVCPVRARSKPSRLDFLSGASSVEYPKLAVSVAKDARRSQTCNAGLFGKEPA